jgi:hypothetical protein
VYGFRGNARNYDLNRDLSNQIPKHQEFCWNIPYNKCRCFIDNHVSNGSDYQYKLTYYDAA